VGRFTPALADLSVISADNEDIFLDNSLSGGAVTAYDDLGAPANVQFRWAKTDNAAGGGDTWNLFYKTSDSATGATTKWTNVGQDYAFDAQGRLSPAVDATTVTGMTVNGIALGNVTLNHGSSNITQYNDENGTVSTNQLDQNGYPSGELVSIAVSENGRVTGTYSNGKTIDLAEISLARFNAADKLKKMDGTAFAATQESGEPMLGGGGDIIGSAKEASNVDIADEFSKLIVTQQAYTAGTRIVTTADELIQETLNMKR
jgi:flagellar hook protein FlgE